MRHWLALLALFLALPSCTDYIGPSRVPNARLSVVVQVSPAVVDTLVVQHLNTGLVQRVVTGERSCVTIDLGAYLVEQFYLWSDTANGRLYPYIRYVWAQRDGADRTVWFFGVGGGIISTDSLSTGLAC